MDKMYAYLIDNKKETVNLRKINKPAIKENEVLLKVISWSICRTDISHIQNRLGVNANQMIPGHEVVGIVEESLDPRFQEGDILAYMGATDFGGAAEYKKLKCVLKDDDVEGQVGTPTEWFFTDRHFYDTYGAAVVKIEKHCKDIISLGSLLEPLCCILRAMEKHTPKENENIIVLGAGSIGNLTIQCLKRIYKANKILVIDIDSEKLNELKSVYSEFDEDIITVCLREGSEQKIFDLINGFKGEFGSYLFDALPPYIDTEKYLDARYVGANFLSPEGRYILFSATIMPEKTKLFWTILSKGLIVTATGFDQRSYAMPVTASVMSKAYEEVKKGNIDLNKVFSNRINFYDEDEVKSCINNYGKGKYRWKTIVDIKKKK